VNGPVKVNWPMAVHVEYVVVKVVVGEDFFKHAGLPCEPPIHLRAIQIHCISDAAVPHRQSRCHHHHHHQ